MPFSDLSNNPFLVNKVLCSKSRIKAKTSSQQDEIVALSAIRVSLSVVPLCQCCCPCQSIQRKPLIQTKTPCCMQDVSLNRRCQCCCLRTSLQAKFRADRNKSSRRVRVMLSSPSCHRACQCCYPRSSIKKELPINEKKVVILELRRV